MDDNKGIRILASHFRHRMKAEQLSDDELANALINHVWSEMSIGDLDEALVIEAIDRLESKGDDKMSKSPAAAALVKITKENAGPVAEAALSGYIGEECEFCDEVFETLDDLKDAVVSSIGPDLRIAHRACFQEVHGG